MFARRLQKLREDRNLQKIELAKLTGINNAVLGFYEKGTRLPSYENLEKLADFFHVSIDYLMGRIDDNGIDENVDLPVISTTIPIDVLGKVPAGIPVEAIQERIDTVEIPLEWTKGGKEFIGLMVSGDSMEPKYLIGDIVILQLQSDCESGQDAVVYVNGYDATLKTVKKAGPMVILQPLNPKYETKKFGPNDEQVRILGVVKRLIRDV